MNVTNEDMPTIARIRAKVRRAAKDGDISVPDLVAAFGLMSPNPILDRIQKGKFSGVKVLGEWRVDTQSVEDYLTKLNKEFKKS